MHNLITISYTGPMMMACVRAVGKSEDESMGLHIHDTSFLRTEREQKCTYDFTCLALTSRILEDIVPLRRLDKQQIEKKIEKANNLLYIHKVSSLKLEDVRYKAFVLLTKIESKYNIHGLT